MFVHVDVVSFTILVLILLPTNNIQPEVARYLACTARGSCVSRAVGEAGGALAKILGRFLSYLLPTLIL